jgi:hypothetical protein
MISHNLLIFQARCISKTGFGRDIDSWGRRKRSAEENSTATQTVPIIVATTEPTKPFSEAEASDDAKAADVLQKPVSNNSMMDSWKTSGRVLGSEDGSANGTEGKDKASALPLAFLIKRTRELANESGLSSTIAPAVSSTTEGAEKLPGDMAMSIKAS